MKKLKLTELKVQSFVTELNNKNHINGGIGSNGDVDGRRSRTGCGDTNDDPDDSAYGSDSQY